MNVDKIERSLPLGELAPREWCLLAAAAEQKCVEVISALAESIGSSDPKLAAILCAIASEEESHLNAVLTFQATTQWPKTWHVTRGSAERALHAHFPALYLDPTPADPAAIAARVRAIERQSARFYRTLGVLCTDCDSRAFFCDLAEREASHCDALESTF